MPNLNDLRIKIFADGADLASIARLAENPLIKGFTTNPSLMRKAGVTGYEAFAKEALRLVGDRPISFEVFSDHFNEMYEQARVIASWGENVYVKIPVTNTRGSYAGTLISSLAQEGIQVNVTALFTSEQVTRVAHDLEPRTPAIVSVFAGRIADTGEDAEASMAHARRILRERPSKTELLWASTREVWNIFEAERAGCHIITVTDDVIAKLPLVGKSLEKFSLETVGQFFTDAQAAGYTIPE